MKTKILLLCLSLICGCAPAPAQTSNLLTLINIGTGDPLRTSFGKLDTNLLVLSAVIDANFAASLTNLSITATNLTPGSVATVTNLGVIDGIAYFQIGVPGTNTVTAYALTNSMFSSPTLTLLNTNFTWALSNFMGVFTNVMVVDASPPSYSGGGLSPAQTSTFVTYYSTNGTSGWTTNLPATPNILYVSVIGDTNGVGGAGTVTITSALHPELDGRLNDLTRQELRVATPTNSADAATKSYVDIVAANVAASQWQSSISNYFYGPNNVPVLSLQQSALIYSTNLTISISGTNLVLRMATTNFVSGWQVQISSNLALLNGFVLFTNYIETNISGIVSFTTPLSQLSSPSFFRIVSPQSAGVTSYWPIQTPYIWFGTNVTFGTNTVSSSASSTMGYGAGLMTMDTNYLYLSVASNTWRRIAIPTNTW